MPDRRRLSTSHHHGHQPDDIYYDPNYPQYPQQAVEDPSTPRSHFYDNYGGQYPSHEPQYELPTQYTHRPGLYPSQPELAGPRPDGRQISYIPESYPPQFQSQFDGQAPGAGYQSRSHGSSGDYRQRASGRDPLTIDDEIGYHEQDPAAYGDSRRSSGSRRKSSHSSQGSSQDRYDSATGRSGRHYERRTQPHMVDQLSAAFGNTHINDIAEHPTSGQSQPNISIPQQVTTSSRNNSDLDPRYRLQSPGFFKPGRIFSLLWHENPGSSRTNQSWISESIFKTKYGEDVYSSIRRMVVVKVHKQCSWCFAVYTYGGRGVAKNLSEASNHCIIYTRGNQPYESRDEAQLMTKEPLEVAPVALEEKLDKMSRLNFSKLYTVEHNVKVRPVGKITERSMPKFVEYARREFNF